VLLLVLLLLLLLLLFYSIYVLVSQVIAFSEGFQTKLYTSSFSPFVLHFCIATYHI